MEKKILNALQLLIVLTMIQIFCINVWVGVSIVAIFFIYIINTD